MGLSAWNRKALYFWSLGLVFIWSCFVFCLLFLLFYVICVPVPAEGTKKVNSLPHFAQNNGFIKLTLHPC